MSSSDAAGLPVPLLTKFVAGSDEEVFASNSPVQAEDDDTLLLRLKSSDRESLGVLFVRYARLVLCVGLRVIRQRAEAEDLVHNVFLFLPDKRNLFDPVKGLEREWLAKVTYHRRRKRQKYLLKRCVYDRSNGGSLPDRAKSNGGADYALRSAVAVPAFHVSGVFIREGFTSTLSITDNIRDDIVAASLRKEKNVPGHGSMLVRREWWV